MTKIFIFCSWDTCSHFPKHSATINEGRGICDNAKAAAKLYEFYANLLEASCPKKTAEVVQAREAVESAKETIRGSCADFNY
ncbi:hypothetical protein [Aeromonas sp. QDB63]|uniref:hypothetical protein n=1 Tax=Aeromonas sp. QDB63 TaxID=2989825 RepID=UPI0022E3B5B7|nr:hypothetical protein [Aeromonas sp. QDB63]